MPSSPRTPRPISRRAPTAGRRRAAAKATPRVEDLEGRLLLSHMPRPILHEAPMLVGRPGSVSILRQSNPQAGGVIRKAPNFYEFYVGPRRADLNVIAAIARAMPARGLLTLSGTMQGRINRRPTDPNGQSFYVFGLNRGGPNEVAPFFGRSGVVFDSVVVVAVQTSGISGFVTDLTNGAQTPLPASSIRISGRQVSVTVPTSLLPTPPGGVPLSQYTFNLWPRISLSMENLPNHGSFVASFLPEDGMAPIRAPRVVSRGPRLVGNRPAIGGVGGGAFFPMVPGGGSIVGVGVPGVAYGTPGSGSGGAPPPVNNPPAGGGFIGGSPPPMTGPVGGAPAPGGGGGGGGGGGTPGGGGGGGGGIGYP